MGPRNDNSLRYTRLRAKDIKINSSNDAHHSRRDRCSTIATFQSPRIQLFHQAMHLPKHKLLTYSSGLSMFEMTLSFITFHHFRVETPESVDSTVFSNVNPVVARQTTLPPMTMGIKQKKEIQIAFVLSKLLSTTNSPQSTDFYYYNGFEHNGFPEVAT